MLEKCKSTNNQPFNSEAYPFLPVLFLLEISLFSSYLLAVDPLYDFSLRLNCKNLPFIFCFRKHFIYTGKTLYKIIKY